MFTDLFSDILTGSAASGLSLSGFLICMAAALAVGLAFSAAFRFRAACSRSFALTLALLPSVVAVVIMMVSGSVGAGVAVAGTFSLVRFRSVPGSAREICAVFVTMAAGLAVGMGCVGFALVFSAIMIAVWLVLTAVGFGEPRGPGLERSLRVTVPEDLDYAGAFDQVFEAYTSRHKLVAVKTAAMGSLFKLSYEVTLRAGADEKALIDALRCHNGNLEISSALPASEPAGL